MLHETFGKHKENKLKIIIIIIVKKYSTKNKMITLLLSKFNARKKSKKLKFR